jgi:hypothetical protein
MKRGIVLIVMLLLLFDLAEDGYLGNVKSGPLQAAVSTSVSNAHHYPSRQVDSPSSLPSPDLRDIFSSSQSHLVIPMVQLALKIINSCNTGGSGGIPQ